MNYLGLLGIVLVIAKIWSIGVVATWSWWIVLLPFYLGVAVVLTVFVLGAAGLGILATISAFFRALTGRK